MPALLPSRGKTRNMPADIAADQQEDAADEDCDCGGLTERTGNIADSQALVQGGLVTENFHELCKPFSLHDAKGGCRGFCIPSQQIARSAQPDRHQLWERNEKECSADERRVEYVEAETAEKLLGQNDRHNRTDDRDVKRHSRRKVQSEKQPVRKALPSQTVTSLFIAR